MRDDVCAENTLIKTSIIIFSLGLWLIILSSPAFANLNCEITNSSNCLDVTILKLKGYNDLEYNNSHVELWNYSDTGYPYSLCCSSSNQNLIIDCDDNRAIEVFRLNNQTNAHIQFPSNFNNLIAQWKFNNNFEEDIQGFHATNYDASWVNDRRNNTNEAILFNGSSYLTANVNNFSFNNLSNFSVSFWFKVNDVPIDGNVMGLIGRTNGGRWAVDYYFDGNQLRAGVRGSATYSVGTPFSIDNHSIWHHVVFTYKSEDELALYLNGAKVNSLSTIGASWMVDDSLIYFADFNAAIGGTTRNFIGEIDDVKLFDVAISSSDVISLYNDGLIGHWSLNNNLIDYSSNKNNMSNYGATWINNRYGLSNGALKFNSTLNTYASISTISFSNTDPWSFSHWIKWDGQDDDYVFYAGSGAGTRNFLLRYGNNNRFAFRSQTTGYALFPINGSDNIIDEWTHLVWLADGLGNLSLYVNNELIETLSGVETEVYFNYFGRGYNVRTQDSYPNNTYYLSGSLDAIQIFNRTISSSEINSLFIEDKNTYEYPVCIGGQGSSECVTSLNNCPENYECLGSIASSEGWDYTNAHFADCNYYALNVCCIVASPPDIPVLLYPEHNDSFFINRTPIFNWSNVGGESIEYQIMLAYDEDFNSLVFDEISLNNNYNYISPPLDFGNYYWRVRAFDGELYSEWSNVSNFTLITNVMIDLITANVNFGLLGLGDFNDTSNDEPPPFKFKNVGNVESDLVNITVQESLWSSPNANLGTNYWMMRARPHTSFDVLNSITSWINVSSVNNNLIKKLNYTIDDEVLVDIAITVPLAEPPSNKSANMDFFWGVAT